MFMNLDTLPADHAMYTLLIGDDDGADEVDVIAPRGDNLARVMMAARATGLLEGYEGQRVIGFSNQSEGYVVFEGTRSVLIN